MRVNVIRTESPDMVMKMSLNGFQDSNTMNYFKDNYNNFMNRAGGHADAFVNSVKNVYNYITNTDIIESAKRVLTRADSVLNDRHIYPVNHETIHRPGLLMRRYVMAQPVIYRKYSNNLCSGYEDEWENTEQELPAKWRDDYLHVIDGIVGDESTMFLTEENPLSPRERVIVHDAWDTITTSIACGIDPTDFEKGEI